MKNIIRSWLPAVVGAIIGICYALKESAAWWEWILILLISIGCLYLIKEKCTKPWTYILGMCLGIFLVWFLAIPIFMYCAGVVWLIAVAAFKVVIWGFGALGIIGGVIILVLVIMILKAIFS